MSAPTIYLVVGTPGSGKTWVCNQLKDQFVYLPHDEYKDFKSYITAIKQACQVTSKPILIETPFSVSQFTKELTVTPVFIIETPEVTAARYYARDGKGIPQGHLTRIQTYIERAHELGAFSGTSKEVLEHLKAQV